MYKKTEDLNPYDSVLVDKWFKRGVDNECDEPGDIRDISDDELATRLYDHLLRLNGPMLGNYSIWGMILEASRRLKKNIRLEMT